MTTCPFVSSSGLASNWTSDGAGSSVGLQLELSDQDGEWMGLAAGHVEVARDSQRKISGMQDTTRCRVSGRSLNMPRSRRQGALLHEVTAYRGPSKGRYAPWPT